MDKSTPFFTYTNKVVQCETYWTYYDCKFIRDLKYASNFKTSGKVVCEPIIYYTNIDYKTFACGTTYSQISFDCMSQTYFLNHCETSEIVGVFDTKMQILSIVGDI